MSEGADLTGMELEELVQKTHDDLYDGLAAEVVAGVHEFLRRGWSPYETLTKGLVAGMDIVGKDFRDGILFVPEVLMAAKAMKSKTIAPAEINDHFANRRKRSPAPSPPRAKRAA